MRLILARHGETVWNREGRIMGHSDIDLTELGREQAARLGAALKDENVAALYSSSLTRTIETADEIARFHNVEVIPDDGLMELDAGDLDGLTVDELMARYGEFLKEWTTGGPFVRVPGGESMADLQGRTWEVVQRLVNRHVDGTVVVVSHSLAIQSIVCKALDIRLSNLRRLRMDLASISILDFGRGGASLLLYNDTCHLTNKA